MDVDLRYSIYTLCWLPTFFGPQGGHSMVKSTGGPGSIVWGLGFWLGKDILGFFKNTDLDNS